jgi:hypothetical protein
LPARTAGTQSQHALPALTKEGHHCQAAVLDLGLLEPERLLWVVAVGQVQGVEEAAWQEWLVCIAYAAAGAGGGQAAVSRVLLLACRRPRRAPSRQPRCCARCAVPTLALACKLVMLWEWEATGPTPHRKPASHRRPASNRRPPS